MEKRFYHFEFNGGRVTAASKEEGEEVLVALAFCSPLDQFSRRLGRTISAGRLEKGKYHYSFKKGEFSKATLIEVLSSEAENVDSLLPRWAKA